MADGVTSVFADTGSDDSLEAARRQMPSGRFALIVDDGSHDREHQARALRNLWPLLAEGGIYVIEDVLIDRQPHLAPADCRSELIDLRSVKGRFDDVAIVLRKFVDRSDLS
jgi:cephalosporin hydroxylase